MRIESVIDQSLQNLEVPLRLHEPSHHAKTSVKGAVLVGSQPGDDGVVRAFSGSERVGVCGIQAETMAAVLKGKSPSFGDDASAESHVIAVDEGARVSVLIDNGKVDSIGTCDGGAMVLI